MSNEKYTNAQPMLSLETRKQLNYYQFDTGGAPPVVPDLHCP